AARRRWPRRLLAGTAVALVAAAALGALAAPPVIRRVTEGRLGAWLGRRVTVARVRVNPLTLAVTLEGLRVYERDERTPFAGFSRLRVDVEARSLLRRGLVVRELRLESPRARVVRERADAADPLGGYNVSDIVARLRGAPGGEAPQPRERPPRFSLSNIQIVDGAVTYEDRPTSTRHEVSDLSLGVPFVSTLPADADVFVAPRLSLRVDGTPFVVAARARPFGGARDLTAHVHVGALEVTRWLPLLPVRLPVVVTSARLDADLDVAFAPRAEAPPTLTVRGRLAVDRLAARSPTGAPLGRVDELEVVVREIDVAARRLAFERIRVAGLDARARRLRDGTFDWQRLLAGPGPPPPRARGGARGVAGRAPRIEIGELAIEGARVRLRDETVRPPLAIVVAPIDLAARGLSNAPSARGEVELRLRATPGGTVSEEGTLSLAPLAATGTVTIDVPKVAAFGPYLHEVAAIDAASGRVRVAGRYRLEQARAGPRLVFSGVAVDVQGLVLGPRGVARTKPTLRVPSLSARDTTVDLAGRSISVGPIHGRGGWISVLRGADGDLRLAGLLARRGAPPAPRRPGPPWRLLFTLIDLPAWNARYEDRSVRPPVDVTASSVSLRARDFEVMPALQGRADLDLDVGERGHVAVSGRATIKPLAVGCQATVTTAPIAPFQGYFVRYEGATIAGGTVSAAGRLNLSFAPAPWKPKGREVRLDVAGDAELANVVARDGREGRELIRWRALRISGVALALPPVRLSIRDVALVEPAARLELGPGRRSNLGPFGDPARRRKAEAQPERRRAPGQPARRPSIAIGHFMMRAGRLSFLDRSIRPHFFTEADDLDVEIEGLSSERTARAEARLRGRVEHAGELAVMGTLNPLADKLTLDMKLRLRNLDVPFANPYAARYVGYLIDKGKLDLSVESRVQRGKLDAQSRIVIDELQLGPKVVSPRALKIPVELAVTALRDRSGRFELDVPVSGSVGSPSFRLAPAIEGAITSVLRRVVTLPFAIVGAALRGGGGETLSIVAFAPGASELDAAATRQVAALGGTLRGRREGSFAIEGAADPARDVEAVRGFLREHGRTVDGATEEAALEALARRRAERVRGALARAAPSSAGRLFISRPKVAAGAGTDVRVRVQKD
ncbi:MAG TPA: DUF748 domain-containing protein, partial [Polyangia bacterium]|nr:DUF748 domain-containing protein [Polyangia bacterium]